MRKNKGITKNVFILGIGSDIGRELALRYLDEGYAVAGTYRNKVSVKSLRKYGQIKLYQCNLEKKSSIAGCLAKFKRLSKPWDIFISCVGSMEPIGKFFACDFDQWEQSLTVNSSAQLRFLHGVYALRRKGKTCQVVFFAGGGTNNPFTSYSAYCVSKIMLIKMCELLDDENKDLNVFIIGPGWVRTKIHAQTIKNRFGSGSNYGRTSKFLKSNNPGTDYQDIYDCINWCIKQGITVSGGRNFSVVHDPWQKKGRFLARQLRVDPDKFKLRRFKNS